jgi:DNA invertase Pin-like site-specific DNA recombinase
MKDLGKSAFKAEHLSEGGALGAFMKLVNEGKINKGSWLIVESMDRLSRQAPNLAMQQFLSIINAGIVVHTLIDGQTYYETDSDLAFKIMASLVYMIRANEESATKSKRLSAVWGNKKANALAKPVTSVTPSWIKLVDGKLMLIPEKAEAIRMIFKLTLEGMGTTAIIRKFNQEGIKPISEKDAWGKSYIQKILNNPAVFGEYQPHKIDSDGIRVFDGEPIKDYYPPIVDKQTFLAVKALKAEKIVKAGRKGENFSNLFSGLCKCKCGASMRYNNKGGNLTYLQCSSNQEASGCDVKPYRYDSVENAVISALATSGDATLLALDEKANAEAKQAKGKLLLVDADIAETQRKINNLTDLLADNPSQALMDKLNALESEKIPLEADRENLIIVANKPFMSLADDNLSNTGNIVKLLAVTIKDGSYESRNKLNKLISSFVEKIVFNGKPEIFIHYKTGNTFRTYARNDINLMQLLQEDANNMTLEQEDMDDAFANLMAKE